MIGPQAYENLFQTKHSEWKEFHVEYGGMRYTYSYDWEILSMYESMTEFKEWCIEDVMTLGGKYADGAPTPIEVIE
tara:strand:+ start:2443 stop:2670 length:228 start_codon:yes stop_codon:yes gene_type:complete